MPPAKIARDALACVARRPELAAAVLDDDLQGELSCPIADAPMRRRIPFVFVTGRDGVPLVTKPASPKTVVEALVA